jgi:U5 small nuclear ribonucleoprotein component
MVDMMNFPEMIRNVAVVGHLHHGKTSLIDMLVYETHKMVWDADAAVRYPVVRNLDCHSCPSVVIDSLH